MQMSAEEIVKIENVSKFNKILISKMVLVEDRTGKTLNESNIKTS